MTENPTIQLWNPLVGTRKVAVLDGGGVHVHLPASLAAGVVATCTVSVASAFLEQLACAALHTVGVAGRVDAARRIETALQADGWVDGAARTASIHTKDEPGRALVCVTTQEALEVPEVPGFPNFTNIPNWQAKLEGLRQPRRDRKGLPAMIMARVGGRPGWSMAIGRDIAGERYAEASTSAKRYPFEGWPLIVVAQSGRVDVVEVEWGLENRAEGEIAVMQLTPFEWPPKDQRTKGPETAFVNALKVRALRRHASLTGNPES